MGVIIMQTDLECLEVFKILNVKIFWKSVRDY